MAASSPSLSLIETLHKLQSVGFCLDLPASSDLSPQRLSPVFNRILSLFLQEIHLRKEIRPVPVMLGDGQAVDLFKLFYAVQERGGADSVSAAKGWASVAESVGFDSKVGSSLKLVYVKYLGALERWLEKVLAKKETLSSAIGELKAEVDGLFREVLEANKDEEAKVVTPASGSKKNHFLSPGREGGRRLKLDDNVEDVDNGGNDVVRIEPMSANEEVGLISGVKVLDPKKDGHVEVVTIGSSPKKNQFLTTVRDGEKRLKHDNDEKENSDDSDVVIIEPKVYYGEMGSSSFNKRKRDPLVGLLDWVLRVARNPRDPTITGVLPVDGEIEKEQNTIGKLYSEVLLARKAMFLKKIRRIDADASTTEQVKDMHPPLSEDGIDADLPASEKLRQSQRILSARKQSNSGSEVSIIRDREVDKGAAGEVNTGKRKQRNPSPLSKIMSRLLPKDQKLQRVPVGSSFQAKVPPWTGKFSATSDDCDDLKWLGTPIWPPKDEVNRPFRYDPIGRGRQDSCRCKSPVSVDCVRFHVAERRFVLKRELGSAFYSWKFDRMGEEVSLSWTEEEARKFKDIVCRNLPCLNENVWDQLHLGFPLKGRKNLVSYYFNVFVLGRRSYQNRVTPNSIDSDDEETEFGFLSNPLGHDALKVDALKSNVCFLNAQCMDLED